MGGGDEVEQLREEIAELEAALDEAAEEEESQARVSRKELEKLRRAARAWEAERQDLERQLARLERGLEEVLITGPCVRREGGG
jgi:Skp family chaperone for outer membrane proteins